MSIWYKIEGTLDHHVNARIREKNPQVLLLGFYQSPGNSSYLSSMVR